MTPAETARLLVFVSAICPSENRHEMSTEIWYPQVADLPATDALTATIQLARRRCDVTAGDVRAEVLTMRGQRLAQGSSSPAGAETSDSCRAGALRVVRGGARRTLHRPRERYPVAQGPRPPTPTHRGRNMS
jgi:hypothetical protein